MKITSKDKKLYPIGQGRPDIIFWCENDTFGQRPQSVGHGRPTVTAA